MRGALGLLGALATAAAAQGVSPPAPAASAAAPAAAPATLPPVRIEAQRDNPTDARRRASAAKIVIGREEIEQFGDSTLGEVIRRLPGVTQGGRPGRGGELRMRGLGGGYTQILIDGERAPPGFSIEQLSPELVERIELLRAPTAETGTRAIAGTINIVLREPLRAQSDELRATLGEEQGRLSPHFSWTRNQRFGTAHAATFTLNAGQTRQRTQARTRTTHQDADAAAPVLDHAGTETTASRRGNVNLSARVQWRLGPGEQLTLQPFVLASESHSDGTGTLAAVGGDTPAPYASSGSSGDSRYQVARLNAQLMKRLGPDTRVELRGQAGRFRLDSESRDGQFDGAGASQLEQDSSTAIRDRSWSLTGKLLQTLGEGHALVGGWELEQVVRTENTSTLVNGALQEGDFGTDVQARTRRRALYLQDEWDPAPDWSAYLGLRAEAIRTRSDDGAQPVDNEHTVVSPLGHVVWRYAAPRRDQLRLSLTQSYRAPALRQLIGVPVLNTLYPVPGANLASAPDRAGNPDLQPEVAHGIDLAWERYLEAGGVVSVNLFQRRIRRLIRSVTALEDVSWADEPRWVARPRNLGDATTRGIEFDAKFRLTDWRADLPPLSLRLNLSLYDSSVDSVPGPDNRIDQQPHATGNVGADYRFPGTGWTLGGNLGWTPGYRTQLTELQAQELGRRRVLDAYLLWQASPSTRLRLSLSNLAPLDSVSRSSVWQGSQLQTVQTTGATALATSLRLEIKL
ncbi:MAG: TonB-dependent receptor, partial [Piscinibacter sp.]|nr:TonB-dependent receptor [Piscinibacter sp.]